MSAGPTGATQTPEGNVPVGDLVDWPAPGFEDTELGVFMGPEVSRGETKVYAGVQA